MKNELTKSMQSLTTRSGVALLVVAVVLVEVMGVAQYIFSRNGIRAEVEGRARTEMRARTLEIQNMVASVEVAVGNMVWSLEQAIGDEAELYRVERQIMEKNPIINGCAIGFKADYVQGRGRWYEPFTGREGGALVHRQIGDSTHNYLEMEWFREGLAAEGGRWTEPYYDDAGSEALVCSFTMPVHDRNGQVVGVFCSDVSLGWLVERYGMRNAMESTILTSREGRILACPDKTMVMRATLHDFAHAFDDTAVDRMCAAMLSGDSGHADIRNNDGERGYAYFCPIEGGTGWSMAIIFSDKEIYAGLNRVGRLLALFTLLGFLLMAFILWRTLRGHKRLEAVSAEKERIGSELKIASGIQKGMLPKTFPPYPDRDEVAIYGCLIPAKEVGGDLYDFYIRDEKLFFCLGDVSGKGVPASLVMAVTRSLFRTVSAHIDSPEEVMRQMNNAMSEMNESSMFVTLFVGVLDLRTGGLRYSNAGHCPPVVLGDGKAVALEMDANIPVGLMPNWGYTLQQTTMAPGQTLFLYTDGLTEAENAAHGQFGEERMMAFLSQAAPEPRRLIEAATEAVHAFVDGAEQSDDLTMMAVEFTKYLVDQQFVRSIVLHNDVQEVPQLAAFVEEVAEAQGLDMSATMNLNLALEEAVVNVMNYAYPKGTQGEIHVEAARTGSELAFTLKDSGTPFDPTQAGEPDTTLAAEDRPIGGLGIHLVRQLMDGVRYEYKGGYNILTLTKKI